MDEMEMNLNIIKKNRYLIFLTLLFVNFKKMFLCCWVPYKHTQHPKPIPVVYFKILSKDYTSCCIYFGLW